MSKSYYNSDTGEIYIDPKAKNIALELMHELGHKHLEEKTNISFLNQISVFILLFAIVFQTKQWQIAGFIFWIGLQILDEAYAWKFAYGKIRLSKNSTKIRR